MIFKKLREAMDQLPTMTINGKDYKPRFEVGTKEQLTAFLSVTRKAGERIYPLIWLETQMEEGSVVELNFVLATINSRTDMGNWDRLDLTFGTTLEPLLDNLIIALKQSGILSTTGEWDRYYRGTRYFNYHVTPDIWDAIGFTVEMNYKAECKVKTIYF